VDSPREDLEIFESQMTLSPTWSQPRSFERWRLRDLLDGPHAFGDGKAGLEAEAEGQEVCEGLRTTDWEESEDSMVASSITEAESQDVTEWLLRVHPELKIGGKAPPYESSSSSRKSGSDSAKNNRNKRSSGSQAEQSEVIVADNTPPSGRNFKKSGRPDPIVNHVEKKGKMSPDKTLNSLAESEPQSGGSGGAEDHGEIQDGGLSESLDPLTEFLDIFEGGSSMQPQDSY
jgi:hypothetical protein